MRHTRPPEFSVEITGALRRAAPSRTRPTPRRADLVRPAALLCLAFGFLLGGIVVFVALIVLGGASLWLSVQRDDGVSERDIDAAFDRTTGLPLASVLETVLADDLVTRSLNGRLAVVAVEVPELAARRAAGDHAAADALLTSLVHRLQRHGWVGANDGPFGPLVFVRRPGAFYLVLRDMLDDRTTGWLAGRMLEVLDEPVRWGSETIEPRVALGVAVGSVDERVELAWRANEARRRAQRAGAGSVVFWQDRETLDTVAHQEWLVTAADEVPMGPLFRPRTARGEMFTELSAFLRAFETALEWAADSGDRAFVAVPSTTLFHWGAPAQITARVNAAGQHGRIGLVAPAGLADRDVGSVHETLETLRRCGIDVYVDRGHDGSPWASHERFDGVVVEAGADVGAFAATGLPVARVAERSVDAEPRNAVAGLGPDDAVLRAVLDGAGANRPVSGGRATQYAQDLGVPAR